jgi:hypothetical protein
MTIQNFCDNDSNPCDGEPNVCDGDLRFARLLELFSTIAHSWAALPFQPRQCGLGYEAL